MPTDTSPNLALPLLQPAQAQKHVTHNEALARLDLLVQLSVESFGAEVPPADPAEGEVHALGPAPTGPWSGQGLRLAAFQNGGWVFVAPRPGWRAWGRAEAVLGVWTGAAWETAGIADLDGLDGVGINATADAGNRLALASPAALFSHEGSDHRLKINKAAAGDTGSVLFQTGFSGRAEIGLTGSDDLAFRVSPDGAAFVTAARIDRASGAVSLPQGLDSLQLHVPSGTVAAIPTPSAGGFVFLSLVSAAAPAEAAAVLVYGTGAAPVLQTVWAGPAVTNLGTALPTGTTGAAGSLSVAAGADGRLHVENRLGAGLTQICLTFLNGFRPI